MENKSTILPQVVSMARGIRSKGIIPSLAVIGANLYLMLVHEENGGTEPIGSINIDGERVVVVAVPGNDTLRVFGNNVERPPLSVPIPKMTEVINTPEKPYFFRIDRNTVSEDTMRRHQLEYDKLYIATQDQVDLSMRNEYRVKPLGKEVYLNHKQIISYHEILKVN